jgi:phage terminase small subunit
MPAKKPSSLIDWNRAKEAQKARESTEAAMTPKIHLRKKAPKDLNGHPDAIAMWNRLIKLYGSLDAAIVTSLDQDLLVSLCRTCEEAMEVYELRQEVRALWATHKNVLVAIKPSPDQLKDYFNALAQANALLQRFQGLDARLDGKKKLIHQLSQSLYLTPRARTGAVPQEKEPEEPKDEMEKLLSGE